MIRLGATFKSARHRFFLSVTTGLLILIIVELIFTTARRGPDSADLIGIWKTDVIYSEWGKVVMEAHFINTSNVAFTVRPPGGGEAFESKGAYSIKHGKMISSAINKGDPVSVRLENSDLIIQAGSEPSQRYHRHKSHSNRQ